jgi:eukaryotic-like serine/threonine-protein kinase
MSDGETLTIDDYQLVNCIATGSSSQVWEVLQLSTSQSFAMKLLLEEALEDVEQRNTMKHEAKVGKALHHPNIIQIYDSKVSKKQAYIIMELFKAANLKSMIRTSLLDVHCRMSKLAESVASAYAFMHEKGWIHKDVKPENILMTRGSEVRVIDFSLAAKPDSAIGRMVTRKSNIAIQGTRTYIAPELIRRDRLTPKADIYSLGITFYECLTGRPPFTGTNPNALLMSHIQEKPPAPSEFHKNISPQADALIARMLAKKIADRHDSMQEVFTEVRGINFFKMDPLEFDRQKQAAAAAEKEVTIDQRLDSRSDHEHTQKHGPQSSRPQTKKPQPPPAESRPAQPAAKAPSQPPQHQQPPQGFPQPQHMPPGMFPPQGMPGYPQMPMYPGMMPPHMMPPGMPPYGQPQYGQPQYGQPMPGQQMPPMPGQPPMPPQAMPGAPQPPQQHSPQQQPTQQQPAAQPAPAAGAPPQPPPAAPQPPPPPSAPARPQQPADEPEIPEDIDWLKIQ